MESKVPHWRALLEGKLDALVLLLAVVIYGVDKTNETAKKTSIYIAPVIELNTLHA